MFSNFYLLDRKRLERGCCIRNCRRRCRMWNSGRHLHKVALELRFNPCEQKNQHSKFFLFRICDFRAIKNFPNWHFRSSVKNARSSNLLLELINIQEKNRKISRCGCRPYLWIRGDHVTTRSNSAWDWSVLEISGIWNYDRKSTR